MLPLDLVRAVAEASVKIGSPYFVTGSVASSYWGVYRTTHDVDIVVELPSWRVREFCGSFPPPD